MLTNLAIRQALKKPSPRSIPLTGPRAKENDFYAIYLDVPEYDWKFLVNSEIHGKGYSGKLWINERDGRECSMLNSTIARSRTGVLIEHYYRGNQFDYRSSTWFLIAQLVRWHDILILTNRISQDFYNRKTLLRAERIELLRYLVEETIQRPGARFDPLFLGIQLHSRRWFYHPQREEHEAHLRLVLESLAETGDLKKQEMHFVVAPKALATLSEFEKEEQRHQDNLNTTRVGHRISQAILLVGILAIVARLGTWWLGR